MIQFLLSTCRIQLRPAQLPHNLPRSVTATQSKAPTLHTPNMANEDEEVDFGTIPERRLSADSADGDDGNPPDEDSDFDPDSALADMEAANQDNADDGSHDADNHLNGNDHDAGANDNDAAPTPTAKPKPPRMAFDCTHVSAPRTTKFGLGYIGQWSEPNKEVAYICGTNWDISMYNAGERPPHWPKKRMPCGEVRLNKGEPIRCKECGGRLLLKKRTGRMVQFEAR
ncbi:hypothetical protein PMIN06_008055 [Paraphaeosphaeria minitans]